MDANEEYVRSKWVQVTLNDLRGNGTLFQIYIRFIGHIRSTWYSEAEAWAAAAEFTRERERLITEKREEIEWANGFGHMSSSCACYTCRIRDRILTSLESQLSELTKGMKEGV